MLPIFYTWHQFHWSNEPRVHQCYWFKPARPTSGEIANPSSNQVLSHIGVYRSWLAPWIALNGIWATSAAHMSHEHTKAHPKLPAPLLSKPDEASKWSSRAAPWLMHCCNQAMKWLKGLPNAGKYFNALELNFQISINSRNRLAKKCCQFNS